MRIVTQMFQHLKRIRRLSRRQHFPAPSKMANNYPDIQQGLFIVLCHVNLLSNYSSTKSMVSIICSSKGKKAQKPIAVKEPQDNTCGLPTQALPCKSKPKSKVKLKSEPAIKDENRSDATVCSKDEDMVKKKKQEWLTNSNLPPALVRNSKLWWLAVLPNTPQLYHQCPAALGN